MAQRLKILVVEDSLSDAELLVRELARYGYEVDWSQVETEPDYVAHLSDDLDVIISDYEMPEFSGMAALELRNLHLPEVPFIVVSGVIGEDFAVEAMRRGASDYLLKGRLPRLPMTLEAVLERRALRLSQAKSAEALRESEARFQAAFEQSDMGMALVNLDGDITRANSAYARITSRSPEELPGLALRELIHAADLEAAAKHWRSVLRDTAVPQAQERRYRRADGQLVWVAATLSLVRLEDGSPSYLVEMIEDLTPRRSLEAQLRHAQKMEAVGRLAGGVAHDFNNLLTVIMSQASLLEIDCEGAPAVAAGLAEIRGAAKRAARLTQQLLLFSRREVLQSTVFDLNVSIASVVKMLSRLMGEKVRLEVNPAATPVIVEADAGMLDQVLMNFSINARDAMPQGGVLRISTRVAIVDPESEEVLRDLNAGPHALIEVADTGTGIPPDVLPRIFEPFFTTKRASQGTGLGLATVFGIVKQHHGAVTVRTAPGQGTTFRVLLPLSSKPVSDAAAHEATGGQGANVGERVILLVEDDDAVHRAIRSVLQHAGFQLVCARDGETARQAWREQGDRVDLLLTDVVFPGELDGQELAAELRRERPGLPVLFVSGYSERLAGRQLGLGPGELYLQKPFAMARLVAAVNSLLLASCN